MKNFKIIFLALSLFFVYSCDNVESEVLVDADSISAEVESRMNICQPPVPLNLALDNFAGHLSSNFPAPPNSMWDDWRILLCAIDVANGDTSFPNCATDFPSTCEQIGVSGPNVGLPCPDFIDMAYCRVNCYVRDYVSNPTDVGLVNIKGAFCDYLLAINNCLRDVPGFRPINLSRYCGL